jgi:DNA-binding PadR family transcriptional regulator
MRAESLKGHLDALILAVLADGPLHGYAIIEKLKRRSDGTFELPEGTVYPALHRLEAGGLLSSEWSDGEAGAAASISSRAEGGASWAPGAANGGSSPARSRRCW